MFALRGFGAVLGGFGVGGSGACGIGRSFVR